VSRTSRLLNVLTLRCEAASQSSSRELDEALSFLDRSVQIVPAIPHSDSLDSQGGAPA
jgi:hypothetical protein